jgi:hypothetical protein
VSRVEPSVAVARVSPPTGQSDPPANSITHDTEAGQADAGAAPAPIVGAGCGLFLARSLADRLGRPFLPFDALIDADPACHNWVATCAPAVAVAVLLEREMP